MPPLKKPARITGKSKSVKRLKHTYLPTKFPIVLHEPIDKLEDRVEALEKIVDELLASKRKRTEYMREYMARDRKSKREG